MKASTSYNDFKGTASADVSDAVNNCGGSHYIDKVAKFIKLNTSRYDLLGFSIYGTKELSLSFICLDKLKTKESDENYFVQMLYDGSDKVNTLFKQINIILHKENDVKFSEIKYSEEVHFNDFHNI
jgi:hypothetical protein